MTAPSETDDTEEARPPRTERIVILLNPPMLIDVAVRLMAAINREFPGARMPFDDPDGNLVIEVDADSEPSEDWD